MENNVINNPPRLGNEHLSAVPVALFQTQTGPLYMVLGNDRLFPGQHKETVLRKQLGYDESAVEQLRQD